MKNELRLTLLAMALALAIAPVIGTSTADPGGDPTCDGIDDDADGRVDEEYVSLRTTCGVGACRSVGTTSCYRGVVLDSCTTGVPTEETCGNGVDNDCDGAIDEGCSRSCGEPYSIDAATIALYHFDSGVAATAIDAVGYNDGELLGDSDIGSGRFDGGVELDGDEDYVRLGNVHRFPVRLVDRGTVEAWVRLESAPEFFAVVAAGRDYGMQWDDGFLLGRHGGYGTTLKFGVWAGHDWAFAISDVDPASLIDAWHHIAGTWGPEGVELWLDGVRIAHHPFTGGLPNPDYVTVLVGTDSWLWDTTGSIDEIRLSDVQREFRECLFTAGPESAVP